MNFKKTLTLAFVGTLLLCGSLLYARRPVPASPPKAPTAAALPRVAAEGRVVTYPGGEIVVGTDFAGTLVRLAVKEKDVVKKGDLIAELNAGEEKAALVQARARVSEADADVRLAEFELQRAAHLRETKVGSQQAVDKAGRDRDAALARRATAVADVDRLVARIAKTRITAPIDGVVLVRHAEAGETVDRGARLVTVANLRRLRIEAEVDEFDSERIALGASANVRVEGDSGTTWSGRVEEIPDAVTARKLKPQDPGRPSDTRVLLVKIALHDTSGLKLGRRVEVEIESQRRAN